MLEGQKLLLAGQKLLLAGQKLVLEGQKLVPAGQKPVPAGQKPVLAGQKLVLARHNLVLARHELLLARHELLLANGETKQFDHDPTEMEFVRAVRSPNGTRLFRDSIALESAAPGRVLFEPFVGIAPLRFREFFLTPDRKDDNGRIISWDEIKRSALPRIESDPRSYIRHELVAVEELGRALADAGVKIRETTN